MELHFTQEGGYDFASGVLGALNPQRKLFKGLLEFFKIASTFVYYFIREKSVMKAMKGTIVSYLLSKCALSNYIDKYCSGLFTDKQKYLKAFCYTIFDFVISVADIVIDIVRAPIWNKASAISKGKKNLKKNLCSIRDRYKNR